MERRSRVRERSLLVQVRRNLMMKLMSLFVRVWDLLLLRNMVVVVVGMVLELVVKRRRRLGRVREGGGGRWVRGWWDWERG